MTTQNEKRKVKSFSLNSDEDKDIIKKLESVANISDYIKNLIREDIKNGGSLSKEQIEEVKKIVMQILKDKSIEIKEENFDIDAIDALCQFDDL